jgi:hypothetical protein
VLDRDRALSLLEEDAVYLKDSAARGIEAELPHGAVCVIVHRGTVLTLTASAMSATVPVRIPRLGGVEGTIGDTWIRRGAQQTSTCQAASSESGEIRGSASFTEVSSRSSMRGRSSGTKRAR